MQWSVPLGHLDQHDTLVLYEPFSEPVIRSLMKEVNSRVECRVSCFVPEQPKDIAAVTTDDDRIRLEHIERNSTFSQI